jgi:hypothetical protein
MKEEDEFAKGMTMIRYILSFGNSFFHELITHLMAG